MEKESNLDCVLAYEHYNMSFIDKFIAILCFPFGTLDFLADHFKYKKEFWRFK